MTLTHWDSRTDNLFFDSSKPAGSAESCRIIDWQMIQRQRGAHDLSMLLATSLSVEDRRAHDAEVLRAYHAELCARGVEGYSYEDLCEPAPLPSPDPICVDVMSCLARMSCKAHLTSCQKHDGMDVSCTPPLTAWPLAVGQIATSAWA